MSASAGVSGERRASFVRSIGAWAVSPWIAYPAITLLQTKILWGAWTYRDLTVGDTASNFRRASLWFRFGTGDPIWSPLYTAFYALTYWVTGDVYTATIVHRILIALFVGVLVLALFRRLLSPGVAWLAAAWWVTVPYNFDVFEVHLFSILPLVAAPLAILVWPGPRGRGVALAVMAGSAVLVRNEMAITAVLLAALFTVWELRYAGAFEEGTPRDRPTYVKAYGVPMAAAVALVAVFAARSVIPMSQLRTAYRPKHTVNMCQSYTFGYKQRHPEWTLDHWTQCSLLMQVEFGEPFPSLATMTRRNPRAVFEHVTWNLGLLPAGVQLSLFGATSGGATPDYNPVPVRWSRALLGSAAFAFLLVAALVVRRRAPGFAFPPAHGARRLGFLTLASSAAVALFLVVPTQRPRPGYLYGLTLLLVAAVGWAADVFLSRWPCTRASGLWIPATMAIALVLTPRYYLPRGATPAVRPLLDTLRRLESHRDLLSRPGTVSLAGSFSFSLERYLVRWSEAEYRDAALQPPSSWMEAQGSAPKVIGAADLNRLRSDQTVEAFLGQLGVSVFYMDEATCQRLRSNTLHRAFLETVGRNGWLRLDGGLAGDGEWMLISRAS